jgi:hypothetical protein
MNRAGLPGWWQQESPKQRAREEKLLAHPVRSAVRLAVLWGVGMWLLMLRSTDLTALTVLAIGSAAFGAFVVLATSRRHRRRTRSDAA